MTERGGRIFLLQLRSLRSADETTRNLRLLLKKSLRQLGFQCIDLKWWPRMQTKHDFEPRYPKIEDPRIAVTIRKDGNALPVTLSAYNEFSRIARLSNVALRLSYYTLVKIAELRDHKGVLGAEWRALPDGAAIAEVHAAWEAEGEHTTDQFYNGRPLLANQCDDPPSAFGANTLKGTAVDNILGPEPEGT